MTIWWWPEQPQTSKQRKVQVMTMRRKGFVIALIVVTGFAVALGGEATPVAAASSVTATELVYANGQQWAMLTPHLITNPSPQLEASAANANLYVLVYPVAAMGLCSQTALEARSCGRLSLPSGYQPQCDPCATGNPLIAYHDHVLSGSPGCGTGGTAGSYKGPWRLILLQYDPHVAASPSFRPITSDEALDAAEVTGEFSPINPGAANPYELNTGFVVICPVVSPAA